MKRFCKIIELLFVVWFAVLLLSCQKESLSQIMRNNRLLPSDNWIHDEPANQGVVNALEKASLVAGVEWVPMNPVPSVYSDNPYPVDVVRQGLPYSLAQKVNGYVGLDVSFYTFLTALANPRSVIYTENLKLPPYNGFDAAPYYGTVCATSVWYALGIKAPYYTYSIGHISSLTKRNDLPPDSIQLCDVLKETGHVAMIYDIARDFNDSIKQVVIFETTRSAQSDSRLIEYDYQGFVNRWNNGNYVIYRPKDLTNNPALDEPDLRRIAGRWRFVSSYNMDLCTSRGDKVAYPVGDTVVINVLSNCYNHLELYKDGSIFREVDLLTYEEYAVNEKKNYPYYNKDVVFVDLPYGSYRACLRDALGNVSSDTFFEIIDINVSFVVGNNLTVYFSSANAIPEFMSLGDIRECPYYITIFTNSQIAAGSATVSLSSDYLKVHFRGEYGRVSNKLIQVQ